MACTCPTNYILDGEIPQYTYCVAKTCSANGTTYPKEYWINKTIQCTNTVVPYDVSYVNCDQQGGCCV
ncbi:hypothetical protein OMP38_06940 [Cohnella ginsengisoli]|uniref:Uncharacterized protein n=1 Tax=Cohnella ginsengisoli TaxID=425004 RepID=A0A9X4KEF3_9BACL|nr:hypothetical protein [Cohnella ginsengisoli]MDG0790619.1 hypothetical protein [Cohnella ginsengisoli]